MSENSSASAAQPAPEPAPRSAAEPSDEALHGAVIVGAVPGQSVRVLREAAHYAKLHGVYLVVVHVDVTRFITYEDPDGYVHSAPIDMTVAAGAADLADVTAAASAALSERGVDWVMRQLVGDPALAIKHLADRIDARLIVVGTRKRGISDSIREFFTGSVAARLAHRQTHNILVVPTGEPVPDDQAIWGE